MQQSLKTCTVLSEKQSKTLEKHVPSHADLIPIARLFSALSDPNRVRIVCALSICNMCVSDLSAHLNVNQTTLSHQLAILKERDVLECERDGKIVVYKIKNKKIFDLFLEAVCTIEEK